MEAFRPFVFIPFPYIYLSALQRSSRSSSLGIVFFPSTFTPLNRSNIYEPVLLIACIHITRGFRRRFRFYQVQSEQAMDYSFSIFCFPFFFFFFPVLYLQTSVLLAHIYFYFRRRQKKRNQNCLIFKALLHRHFHHAYRRDRMQQHLSCPLRKG